MSAPVVTAAVIDDSSAGSDGAEVVEDIVIKKGWLTKKPPKGIGKKSRKRYFVMKQSGQVCYYAAESPENEPVGLKGIFTIFKDTKVSRAAVSGKKTELVNVVIDTSDREWMLTAESEGVAAEWETAVNQVIKASETSLDEYKAQVALSKQQSGGMVAKLAEKCANSLKTAQAQMRTFGFGGSVTVTGSVLGLSVSMGLEIEVESEEGEIAIDEKAKQEIAENRKELQENSENETVGVLSDEDGEDADTVEEEDVSDPSQPDPPEKESRFKRALTKGMRGAMGKVKVLAYTMKKYSLTGTIGVGVDLTMFGTGISIEFEVSLSSAISEAEYEEMKENEKMKKTVKKDQKSVVKAAKKEEKAAKKS